MSSPTFFGDKPRGPILGASVAEAPTSPPVALRWLESRSVKAAFDVLEDVQFSYMTFTSLGSNFGAISCKELAAELVTLKKTILTHGECER